MKKVDLTLYINFRGSIESFFNFLHNLVENCIEINNECIPQYTDVYHNYICKHQYRMDHLPVATGNSGINELFKMIKDKDSLIIIENSLVHHKNYFSFLHSP